MKRRGKSDGEKRDGEKGEGEKREEEGGATNLMGHFENHVCTGDPDTRRSPSTQLSREGGG